MSTPEGKIKTALKRELARVPECYQFWPVQMGLGAATLDCLLCVSGRFVAVETKAPGKRLTTRQEITAAAIAKAGAMVYVVDSPGMARAVADALIEDHVRNSQQS